MDQDKIEINEESLPDASEEQMPKQDIENASQSPASDTDEASDPMPSSEDIALSDETPDETIADGVDEPEDDLPAEHREAQTATAPETSVQTKKSSVPKERGVDGRYDFVELFVFTLVAVLILTSFFFRHSFVEGDSMEQTLSDGEHLVLASFLYTPKAGDIVVCEDYSTGIRNPIVKRVIATEGQRVDIFSGSEVYVDGVLLDESDYVYIDRPDVFYEYPMSFTVSEGHLFVLGDHRNNSSDSRAFGEISEKSVLGKVVLRILPFDKFGAVD